MAPGSPRAWATPPPAHLRRRLTLNSGFAVLDRQQRRLHDRANALGFTDLHGYLKIRCQQHASLAQLAGELGTTPLLIRRLLDHAGLQPVPPPAAAARQRRRITDQQLTLRAAELGFASLEAYLADRVARRAWPLSRVAVELGVHPATVSDRLGQHGLHRPRPTAGHERAARWAANRQARLAALGFADVEGYLRARRAGQGWSVRRLRAELRVNRAWLVGEMGRLGIR